MVTSYRKTDTWSYKSGVPNLLWPDPIASKSCIEDYIG